MDDLFAELGAAPGTPMPVLAGMGGLGLGPIAPQVQAPDYGAFRQQVLAGLQGTIEPTETMEQYKSGIIMAAAAVILAPLIYLVFMLALLRMVASGAVLFLFPFVLPPLFLGLFVLKPLVGRGAGARANRSLNPEAEPLLFEFVQRIANAVGAPMPTRIDVDWEVNASAGFRRGLLSFLGNDLVLTIGMPLIAGLSTRELAGVLAHEFGHFTQGAGMRLSYLVRWTVGLLREVVYGHDAVDEYFEGRAAAADPGVSVGYVTYWVVAWVGRRAYWPVLWLAQYIAGYLMRQMEFDADRYEARLGGADCFERTTRRLPVLGAAYQGAIIDLQDSFREGRLGDNLPRLMMFNLSQIKPADVRRIEELAAKEQTSLLATHPSDTERIESVQADGAPGIFHVEAPARFLLQNFDTISRTVTWDYYRQLFGKHLRTEQVKPLEGLLPGMAHDAVAREALRRLYQARPLVSRAHPLGHRDVPDVATAIFLLQQQRAVQLPILERYRNAADQYVESMVEWIEARQVVEVGELGIVPSARLYTIPTGLQRARELARADESRIANLGFDLTGYEMAAAIRIEVAIAVLHHPELGPRVPGGDAARQICARVLPAYRGLVSVLASRKEMQLDLALLWALLQHLKGQRTSRLYIKQLLYRMGRVMRAANSIRESLLQIPYPFHLSTHEITVGRYLLEEPLIDEGNLSEIGWAGDDILDKTQFLLGRCLANLSLIVETVEGALGLPPFPDPPVPEEPEDDPNKRRGRRKRRRARS